MKIVEKNPIIMIVLGVFGISLSSIFVKYAQAPSSVTAAYRLLWTVVLMTPFVLGKKSVRKSLLAASAKMAVLSCVSGVFLAFHFVLWFESLQHTSVASSTTIVCTEVVWVAFGFYLLLKGKFRWNTLLAIGISLMGSILITYSDSGSDSHLYGDILALLAAMAVAVYTLIGRVVRSNVSTAVYTYMVYTACAVVLVIACVVGGYGLFDYGLSPVIVGLLLSVFSTLLGHSIFSWCLKYFSPAFVSASKLCEPVVAAVLAGFLFSEVPGWLQILGSLLILGGVYYYSVMETKQQKA